jgi:hypothetical protein
MWRPVLFLMLLIAAGAVLVSTTIQYGAGRELTLPPSLIHLER